MSKKWTPKKSKKNNVEKIGSYMLIYLQYLHAPLYTPEYLYIPSYTPIYIKISNIRKMRFDIRPKNGLKLDPRFWHARYYHTVKGFFTPKGPQF